jgi:hypothetical protein
MDPKIPEAVVAQVERWASLSRWEKAEVGRKLRHLGLTYGEIMGMIPVPKGTLARWCQGLRLSDEQVAAIRTRTGSVRGVPRDTQRRRREEIERLRAEARTEVPALMADPLWLAGTVMYWAEGSKSGSVLSLANSDPAAGSLFIQWTRAHVMSDPVFVLKLNLHADNDESAARAFWLRALGLETSTRFYKTFIKPDGTGHRKNHLTYGVAQIRVRRSADALHRTMGWIRGLSSELQLT